MNDRFNCDKLLSSFSSARRLDLAMMTIASQGYVVREKNDLGADVEDAISCTNGDVY